MKHRTILALQVSDLQHEIALRPSSVTENNLFQSVLQLREKRELEERFKKAQKPWAKLLGKVNKSKADYHNACKAERTAVNQERNASGDSTLSQDQVC